ASKAYLAATALEEGADELDMVINIGALKDRDYHTVGQEIDAIAALKQEYRFILKVIIETAFLSVEELAELIILINQTEADFVKTSTGFGPRGASLEDIANIIKHKRPSLKIKASGGIRDLDLALAMIEAGADRLGTSSAGQLLADYQARP
ncbi:MAG: deoxyribose-phosphate aldolase, partial [Syntrophomonadaceae bacterium]|nr:deoxyribose-phosphate aldolase [Syntrophomonadaceae bacterium]